MHHVVRIHARDRGAAADRQPGAERRDESPVRRADDPQAGLARRPLARDVRRTVGRSVVDEDAFPARLRLLHDAAETGVERRRRLERRQEDRDGGRARHVGR